MSSPSQTQSEMTGARWPTRPAAGLVVTAIMCLAACGFAANLSMPWESDQMPKAAQILEIANQDDYGLSEDLHDYYRLRLFPLYYAVSGLLFDFIGGDIFAFMNLSSVVLGVVAGVSLASALHKALGIGPWWTGLTLIAMPLFVITYSYGNEAAWAMAFFSLSLALVASPRRLWHYLGGAAVAAGLWCRPDVVWLAPYWLAWTAMFCRTDRAESWIKRVRHPAAAFLAAAIGIWLLLVRDVPPFAPPFEWGSSLKLIAAYLSYPFNLSLVILAGIGWLVLIKRNARYAWSHLLLLIPFVFYAGNLSSPKYIIGLLIFYGLPMAYLLQVASNRFRVAMLALVAVWFFVGVSVFGLFGPQKASLWYLPTADGPCPIGGYLNFYARARSGGYQRKQIEQIAEVRDFVEFAKSAEGRYWLAGHWPNNAYSLLRARQELGAPDQRARIESIVNAPGSQGRQQPNDGSRMLLLRTGYSDLESTHAGLSEPVRAWLRKGQLRSHGPRAFEPLPTVIEIGDHVSEGANSVLGQRLLFLDSHYQSHMVFEQPEFVGAYRATSWLRATDVAQAPPAEAVYRDEKVSVFEVPVKDAMIFSYPWPARYYQFKSPKPKRHSSMGR